MAARRTRSSRPSARRLLSTSAAPPSKRSPRDPSRPSPMPEPTPLHPATVLDLPRAVEAGVFTRRYFTHCLDCTFCHDWCCQFGVDVDLLHHRRIVEHAAGIEALTGVPRDQWFDPDPDPDPEMPGGGSRRARV